MMGTGPSSGPPEFRIVLGPLGWGDGPGEGPGDGLGEGEGPGGGLGLGPGDGLGFGFVRSFWASAVSAPNIAGPYNAQLKLKASTARISATTKAKALLSRNRTNSAPPPRSKCYRYIVDIQLLVRQPPLSKRYRLGRQGSKDPISRGVLVCSLSVVARQFLTHG